jgi:hypothetical protein
MKSKLTLSIDQSTVTKAKEYATEKERSLSDIIENYLKFLTAENITTDPELPPVVKSLKGSFKAPSNFDYKAELSDSLSKKYLK